MANSLIWCFAGLFALYACQVCANEKYVVNNGVNSPLLMVGQDLIEDQHHIRRHRHSKNMWNIIDTSKHTNEIFDGGKHSENDGDHQQHNRHRKDKKSQSNCPKCKNELRMTEQELTELRIEYVKKQILRKLKLKERPQVSVSSIPKPVAEGATIQYDDSDDIQQRVSEEFYAKTTQKIIFPQLGKS